MVCDEQENEDNHALDSGGSKSDEEGNDEDLDVGEKGERNAFLNIRGDKATKTIKQHNAYQL